MSSEFYRAFEDKHRGSRELIKSRLRVYLPFVELLKNQGTPCRAIDLGCGRGEWLELLQDAGVTAHGVDLDNGMLAPCRELNLSVEPGDAITYLQRCPDNSFDIVTGFHFVEHLPFERLQMLVQEALRALKPAGLLILETPNPENIRVGTSYFYLDPTHQRPLPIQLLSFLPEYYGYHRTKVLRLQEAPELLSNHSPDLLSVLGGASPDYAIVAQAAADPEVLERFDNLFKQEFGISLDVLALRYDSENRQNLSKVIGLAKEVIQTSEARLHFYEQRVIAAEDRGGEFKRRAIDAEAKVLEMERQATYVEERAREFERRALAAEAWGQGLEQRVVAEETRLQQAESSLAALLASRSWRITLPFRLVGKTLRLFVREIVAWSKFSPQGRPRLVVRNFLLSVKSFVNTRPVLKKSLLHMLGKFPRLELRLRSIGKGWHQFFANVEEGPEALSPRARKIYCELKSFVDRGQGNS